MDSLGPAYLVSYIRDKLGDDFEFKIINNNIKLELEKFKPDLVSISSVTQNYNIAKNYAKITKKRGIPVIIGGIHISLLPQTLDKNMDVGVIGEGEETIVFLIKLFISGNFNKKHLSKINGLVYWDGNMLKQTPKRELINPLDKVPFPARDLLNISEFTHIFTSRGCPYKCCFCSSCRFWKTVRFFSAKYVINEIEELIEKYHATKIVFMDDLFIADKKRLKELVSLIKKRGINKKVEFWIQVRANLVDEDTVKLLKIMNATNVTMGLETGCKKTLEFLKGKTVTIDQNKNAINLLNKYGFNIFSFFIIGSPKETKDEMLETLNFIKTNKINTFKTFILTPLPATPMWKYAKKRGLVSDNMDWSKLDVNYDDNHENAIVLSEILTKEELYQMYLLFQKEMFKKQRYNLIRAGLKKPGKIPIYLLYKYILRKPLYTKINKK